MANVVYNQFDLQDKKAFNEMPWQIMQAGAMIDDARRRDAQQLMSYIGQFGDAGAINQLRDKLGLPTNKPGLLSRIFGSEPVQPEMKMSGAGLGAEGMMNAAIDASKNFANQKIRGLRDIIESKDARKNELAALYNSGGMSSDEYLTKYNAIDEGAREAQRQVYLNQAGLAGTEAKREKAISGVKSFDEALHAKNSKKAMANVKRKLGVKEYGEIANLVNSVGTDKYNEMKQNAFEAMNAYEGSGVVPGDVIAQMPTRDAARAIHQNYWNMIQAGVPSSVAREKTRQAINEYNPYMRTEHKIATDLGLMPDKPVARGGGRGGSDKVWYLISDNEVIATHNEAQDGPLSKKARYNGNWVLSKNVPQSILNNSFGYGKSKEQEPGWFARTFNTDANKEYKKMMDDKMEKRIKMKHASGVALNAEERQYDDEKRLMKIKNKLESGGKASDEDRAFLKKKLQELNG